MQQNTANKLFFYTDRYKAIQTNRQADGYTDMHVFCLSSLPTLTLLSWLYVCKNVLHLTK